MDIKKDIADFKNLDPQRKGVLFALVFVLFIVSILVGSYFSQATLTNKTTINNSNQQTPEVTQQPSTTLALSPENVTVAVGKQQQFEVTLSQVPVTAADIIITYDPDLFTASGVTNGEVFARVIRNKVEAGKITYSGSVSPSSPTDIKTGTVFTFTLTPKKAASSSLVDFDHVDTITAVNGQNTLGLTTGATVTAQ